MRIRLLIASCILAIGVTMIVSSVIASILRDALPLGNSLVGGIGRSSSHYRSNSSHNRDPRVVPYSWTDDVGRRPSSRMNFIGQWRRFGF